MPAVLRRLLRIAPLLLVAALAAAPAAAQDRDAPPAARLDTLRGAPSPFLPGLDFGRLDTLRGAPRAAVLPSRLDTLRGAPTPALPAPALPTPTAGQARRDTLPAVPRPAAGPGEGLPEPVTFSAQDSLVLVLGDDEERALLFGNASVKFGEVQLDAYAIDVLFDREELRAAGLPTDTGMVGRPRIVQSGDTFEGDELSFNLRTSRGRVVAARTQLDDGFITAGIVKVDEDSTLYVKDGVYTTCECRDDPSYSLRAERMKVVDQEWIYTGPIQLFLFNIPTPLWLPFGFLPAQEGRRSGPLPPQYGEDERGFYLRGWGWYQAISPYMDLQVRLGVWTKGSWQVAPLFRYNRRYHYVGELEIDYVHNKRGERGDPDLAVYSTSSLRWNHSQEISPTANLTSDVNLSSQNYLRTVSEQYDDRVRQTVQSSVRYNKRWPSGGRSLTMSLNQRQDLAAGDVTMTLPDVAFTQNARKPFERDGPVAGRDRRWYEEITYNYSGRLNNQFVFRPLSDTTDIAWWETLFSPDRYEEATGEELPFTLTASHRVPVNASFSIDSFFGRPFRANVSPSLNYTEDWFFRTRRRTLDDSTGAVVDTDEPGFLSVRRFSSSVSANTTVYGLFPLRVGPLNGFRHTIRPSASFTYSPDFTNDFWGYTRTYLDAEGDEVDYPIVTTGLGTEQRTLSFQINNVFETKVVRTDTLGETQSRPLTLLNLDVSSGYNFAADSLRLSDVFVSGRTSIRDLFSLNFSATLSPYQLDAATGLRRVDRYIFEETPWRPARLTRLSLTLRTSLQSSRRTGPPRPATSPRARTDVSDFPYTLGPAYLPGDPFAPSYANTVLGYADFAIPWSLELDMTYGVTKPTSAAAVRRAILNARFDVNLTANWKVQGRTGYDFERGEMATTNISILRDFECWEMAFSWVPFGAYQSYSFDLHVKSGKLRDLLRIRQPRADVQGRFGGLLN